MENIDRKIKSIKHKIIDVARTNHFGHLPSAFSCIEILYAIYEIADITKENCTSLDRDKVILSKEHGKIAQLAVLAELSLLNPKIRDEWMRDNGRVGHDIFNFLKNEELASLDFSYSSLGQGLGVGIGMALANPKKNVYVILGDGELQEGSCWEGILFIGHHKIKNITIIVDRNTMQIGDYTKNIIDTSSHLKNQIGSFFFDVIECDGHNIDELKNAILLPSNQPKCVLANTIKGRELWFLKEKYGHYFYHYRTFSPEEFEKIQQEIDKE